MEKSLLRQWKESISYGVVAGKLTRGFGGTVDLTSARVCGDDEEMDRDRVVALFMKEKSAI